MITIVVFDDNITPYAEMICRDVPVPTDIDVYGAKESVDWHEKWNALGDHACILGMVYEKIDNGTAFQLALDWCLKQDHMRRAIVFCDYHLKDVTVTAADVERVGNQALVVANVDSLPAAVNFYNNEAQGLLLAAALGSNSTGDIDLWLATEIGVGVETHVARLNNFRRVNFWPDRASGGSLRPREEASGRAVESVKTAVIKYSERRQLRDPGFWPDYAQTWFANYGSPPVQHRFDPMLTSECLVTYLIELGLNDETARKWANTEAFHETLKHFLGACAVAHSDTGNKALTLGSLILPLVKAAPSFTFFKDFHWELANTEIAPNEKSASRKLIVHAYEVFKKFAAAKTGDGSNEIQVSFARPGDGLHLFCDFQFNCIVGDACATKPSLLSKALFLPWYKADGDSTIALERFLASCADNGKTRRLFVSLYPVEKDGTTWTRFDFKASS